VPTSSTTRRETAVSLRSKTAHGTFRGTFESTEKMMSCVSGWMNTTARNGRSCRMTAASL
jgi:hypothetical protein